MTHFPHNSDHAQRKSILIASLGCLLALLYAFHKVGDKLWAAWQTAEYSHGVLIPFIAVLLAWHRLTDKHPKIHPSSWGAVVMILSGLFLLVGELAAFEAASEYGFILALTGLSLTFLGSAATRNIAPALIYLFFAVPLPHLVYSNLSQELQLLSSTLGVLFLELIGVPVFQEGNIIDLGGYKLQVVEACSGLRYLFPLMSFGYLIAYLLQDKWWKRATILLSTIPITIAMNALRIAIIGVTVNFWGIEMAEGFIHEFEGWTIFMVCIVLLMVEARILLGMRKHGDKLGHLRYEVFGFAHGPLFSGRPHLTRASLVTCSLCLALSVVFGTGLISEREEITPSHPPFSTFPVTIENWRGKPLSLATDVLQALQLNDYWLADYTRKEDEPPVNFYMAYNASQHLGTAAHTPSNCIPGGGWRITESSLKTLMTHGQPLTVTRLLIQRENISQLVYYWFDERGRNITETYSAKWYLLVDSIMMKRTDGALIRLVTSSDNTEKIADAEKRLEDFLAISYPLVKVFVPGESAITEESSGQK